MRRRHVIAGVLAVLVAAAGVSATVLIAQASGTPSVTTAGYNNLRDNWDANEPGLSPSVVQSASFTKLFSTKVSGSVYSQPLIVNGTAIITTEEAKAYGINATTGAIKWTRSFGTPFTASTIGCSDLTPDIGSTSTPVVNPTTGIVYLTTRTETGKGGLANAHWELQALSSTTGKEATGFPVTIKGTPYDTPGVAFNQAYALQRTALLLLNGIVYMGFASDCDLTPYRGIVVGVSTTTHAITTMWSDESGIGTNQNSQAGIWQSGGGLVSDEPSRIVLTTSNGISPQPAPSNRPPKTLSESVIALTVGSNGRITPTQFFAPSNAANLDANDEDLGAGGPMALPTTDFGTKKHPHLLVQVGKDGRIFLVDADDMGGFEQGANHGNAVLQTLGPFGGVWGHPAAYGGQGGWVYVLESGGGVLRALSYGLNGSGVPKLSSSGTSAAHFGYTSGSPLVTSDGTTAGKALVWVVDSNGGTGSGGRLLAYSAIPKSGTLPLLWSAPIGTATKFAVPTAWEGRIYVGTRDGHLLAFGSSAKAPIQAASVDFGSVPVGSSRTLTVSASATRGLTVTGPVTADGYEAAGGGGEPATSTFSPGAATATTMAEGATAGPTTPPPSSTKPLGSTVFSVRQPRPGTRLGAGSTTSLRITFAPTGPGPVVATVSIPTSAGVRTVSVSGYGTQPGLLVSAQPLAFGTVATGAGGKSLTVTVANSWDRPERLTGFGLPSAPYSVSGLPSDGTVLSPQQTLTVSVLFDPARAGTYPSRIRIVSNRGSATLPISGSAVTGVAHLAVSSPVVDAGIVPVGRSLTVTFDVGNSGTIALVITRAIAPAGAFSTTVPMPEDTTIDPGTFLHQTVTFRPTVPGPVIGRYTFKSNNQQGPVTVTLEGTGG